jgi:ketosteroid isomerase-like protein
VPDPLQIVADHYDASSRGDLPGMIATFAPDMRWRSMAPVPLDLTGPDAIVENVFARFAGRYERFGVEVGELVPAGKDDVFMVGHYVGRTHGGEDFRIRVCHRWTVRGEQVVAFEQFADSAPLLQAMGQPA